MSMRKQAKAGFSLVEVALALLVASVGLMAIMGIFPASLDLSKKAQDDTQFALFAEEVMNGLRVIVNSTNVPWSAITDANIRIPVSGEQESTGTAKNYLWDAGASTRLVVAGRGPLAGGYNKFALAPLQNAAIEETVLRYQLSITDIGNNMKRALLVIVPGPAGASTDESIFMTEFHRGDKP